MRYCGERYEYALFELYRRKKLNKKFKIVFDMDDVLWNFNDRVCDRIGLDKSQIVTFHVAKNPLLSDAQKASLIKAYGNVEMFRDIEWHQDIGKINQLVRAGHDIYINSHCINHEIIILKRMQLSSVLEVPDDNILLSVIETDSESKKNIGDDVDIFIDDNPNNIIHSKACINVMPTKTWNTSKYALEELSKSPNVIVVDGLNEVMGYINSMINLCAA